MSDELNITHQPNEPVVIAQLVISMDNAGNVSVTGPIANRLMAYGMIEVARDVIFQYAQQAARSIQPPTAGDMAALATAAAMNNNRRS